MRFICALLFLFGVSLAAPAQSDVSKQNDDAKPPFTLEITANRVEEHSESWDYANSAKTVLKAGSEVVVTTRKTNISDREIPKLSGAGQTYEIRDSGGNLIKPRPFDETRGDGMFSARGVIAGTKDAVLQPGESKATTGRLDIGCETLRVPGTYTIQVSEHISDDPASPVVKSNKITITVLPADAPPTTPK
jgi:hypothetical protein